MNPMKRTLFLILLATVFSLPSLSLSAMREGGHMHGTAVAAQNPDYPPMPAPGKKVPLGSGYYMIYGFDKKPRLGTAIMKVEIFTEDGKKDTSLEVKADADMPSMRGAHASGEKAFQISKKGDYLLPVRIVMPGDWEVKFTVSKDGKVIFRGKYDFDV